VKGAMKIYYLSLLISLGIVASERQSSFEALTCVEKSQSMRLHEIFEKKDLINLSSYEKEHAGPLLIQARKCGEICKQFLTLDKQCFAINYIDYINHPKIMLHDTTCVDHKPSWLENFSATIDSFYIRDKKKYKVKAKSRKKTYPFISKVDASDKRIFLFTYNIRDLTTKDFAVLRMAAGLQKLLDDKPATSYPFNDPFDVGTTLLWHKITECSEHINKKAVDHALNKIRKQANLPLLQRDKNQSWCTIV
jgi:hypothetical protein